ncbi:MAG: 4-(cytidine 5'-diphospho)-2-C-methyl-D-erythritol kinase [Ignavibacteriaceae bacterium]|nr:4-(cytidine 5'-diphospho)-2-C-methyl-D-erythritol kinase [Ignavibacteriaceae bacterium]
MESVRREAHAKINLGLNIINRRNDGFHDIETLFIPIRLHDTITFTLSDKTEFISSAPRLTPAPDDNLIMKALRLTEKIMRKQLNVKIHLEKLVPTGAGLGGGSSDAAATLMALNQLFDLNIEKNVLEKMALLLGSDVPFFLRPNPSLGEGRGEILTEIKLSLSSYYLLLVNPGIHVPTGWAYSKVVPAKPKRSLTTLKEEPDIGLPALTSWLSNDFEKPVFESYPEVRELKKVMSSYGAIYSQMSGSGSSVFALFESPEAVDLCISEINPKYFVYHEKL